MDTAPPARRHREVYEVRNQPPLLAGYNAFDSDPLLRQALAAYEAGWVAERARELGAAAGDARVQKLAHDANRHGPELRAFDRFGRRIDLVDYHPAYHELMALAFGSGVHSLGWAASRPAPHTARAALSYIWNQIENGVGCPTGMAYSSIPALRMNPAIEAEWIPKVLAEDYDPRPVPLHEKPAATIGMTLTEKQGGSDLRANITRAERASDTGEGGYALYGHKWFCSAPMCDGFLTLAQTEEGPSAFFIPRWLPDGTTNPFRIQRLKDKCGNRSNASSEVEFHGTLAWLLGEPGNGIRIGITMAHLTRIDFAVGTSGLMRRALMEAVHHCRHRRAFQKALVDQPVMTGVLVDLALEAAAALLLSLRFSAATDRAGDDEAERHLERIGTPVAKYWVCKRAPAFVAEALECHGGNGYVEEAPMARLYREAPLNGIWEGTSNVVALDVLRALEREPATKDAYLDEIRLAKGMNAELDAAIGRLESVLARSAAELQPRCRQVVELMAVTLQASLMLRHASAKAAEAFCYARLGAEKGLLFGAGPDLAAGRDALDELLPAEAVYASTRP